MKNEFKMTEGEAQVMLKQLAKHYGSPVMPVKYYCKALRDWSELMLKRKAERGEEEGRRFQEESRSIDLAISKSCLLDRIIYGGEQPSKTPCPVHKGIWSGVHYYWPGNFWVDKTGEKKPVKVSEQCQEWYDAGCRCFQHSCGCTTGWQPDEYCGCKK